MFTTTPPYRFPEFKITACNLITWMSRIRISDNKVFSTDDNAAGFLVFPGGHPDPETGNIHYNKRTTVLKCTGWNKKNLNESPEIMLYHTENEGWSYTYGTGAVKCRDADEAVRSFMGLLPGIVALNDDGNISFVFTQNGPHLMLDNRDNSVSLMYPGKSKTEKKIIRTESREAALTVFLQECERIVSEETAREMSLTTSAPVP